MAATKPTMVAGYFNGKQVAKPISVYAFYARFKEKGYNFSDIVKRGEIEVTVPQGTITFKVVE